MAAAAGKLHETLKGFINFEGDYEPVARADGRELTDAEKRITYNKYIKTLSDNLRGYTDDLLTPTCPMGVRKLFTAQHNARVHNKPGNLGNNQSIRMKTFMVATLHFVFTLLARIIRVVLRTVFLPFSVALAAYQQSTYGGKPNRVIEDLKRIGWEWIDLGTTLATPFIALINTVAPRGFNTDGLRDYYIKRLDEARRINAAHENERKAYTQAETDRQTSWDADAAKGVKVT